MFKIFSLEAGYGGICLIPTLARLRQEDSKFKATLSYIMRPVSKKNPVFNEKL
jgi:hypothetical protein